MRHVTHAGDPQHLAELVGGHGHWPRRRGGARLRLARQARGFSQQQMASMAGVSRQAISAIESGAMDPSLRFAFALARTLGMTVENLFGTDNTAAPVAARGVAPLGDAGLAWRQ